MLYIYHSRHRVPLLCKRWKRKFKGKLITSDSRPDFKRHDVIINYGCGETPVWGDDVHFVPILNHWNAVRRCANKLSAFKILTSEAVPCLTWTANKEAAQRWSRVVVRHKLTGTGGDGIEIIHPLKGEEIPDAPLYTNYFKKNTEFRVHVFDGEVIDYTQKRQLLSEHSKERGIETNPYVRNHKNGWVFCREGIIYNDTICELAVKAARAIGVDYAGVDILANFDKETKQLKNAVVCELNSAPGMKKTTYQKYVQTIGKHI